MNKSNHPDPKQSQDPAAKDPDKKRRYVDPPSRGIKPAHVSFVSQTEPQEPQRLDARESLDIPLVSFKTNEAEKESGKKRPPVRPGIDKPLGSPTMPDSERVSQLPEEETEKRYMVQKSHSPAGPHVTVDTPLPEELPSVDTLSRDLQRPRPSRTDLDEIISLSITPREDEAPLEQKILEEDVPAEAKILALETLAPLSDSLETVLEVRGLEKSYRKASIEIPVLRGVDMVVKSGQFVSIVGQSGSGKSTLLHLLGTLDSPDAGQIYFHGHRIDNLSSRRRDMLRNDRFGMIFQFYHLLPELNLLENVLAPLLIRESLPGYFLRRRAHRRRAIELIEAVGLGHRLKHRPRELSGGEMQRAAIARALISQPELLLADEPTGNLDQETGREILDLLGRLNREQNLTIVMVTHDRALAETADQTIGLVDGRIV